MKHQYKIRFIADIARESRGTLQVSRKRGETTFHSDLTADELMEHSDEVGTAIASDLAEQGYVVTDTPEIISIKQIKYKK